MRAAAAGVSIFAGLAMGIPCLFSIRHFARTGEVWYLAGFPTFGDGPFERWGVPTSVGLLATFLAVCVAEVAVGVMIWQDVPAATAVSIALFPIEMVFFVGFALLSAYYLTCRSPYDLTCRSVSAS